MAISTFPIETRTVNIDLLESAETNATAAAASETAAAASATAAAASETAAAASATAAAASADRVDLGDLDAAVAATAADAVATEAARDAAVAAAESSGAFSNTTLAAAVAAGVSALTVGDYFTATGADVDYIGFYVIETGPVATLLYTTPTAAAVEAVADGLADLEAIVDGQAVTVAEWFNCADIARAKAGAYFRVHPDYCFVERSLTPTTKSGLGGLVGCWKSADGAFVAIPEQDDRRPTLQQDTAGNWFLADTTPTATNSINMQVKTAAGVDLDPTTAWTHIGGWRTGPIGDSGAGGGTAFAWGSGPSQTRVIDLRSNNTSGAEVRTQTALNTFTNIFDSTQDAITVPFVLRVVKSLSDVAGFYNLEPTRRAGAVVPWDDSAITRSLILFAIRPDVNSSANFDGRCYGFLQVPGTLTEAETVAATAEIMRHTIPRETANIAPAQPAILDFENDTFTWRGETRAMTDLTDNGGGSYTLADTSCWAQEHTIIVDATSDLTAGSWSGTIIDFAGSGNSSNERVLVLDNTALTYRGAMGLRQTGAKAENGANGDGSQRGRLAWVIRPGEPVQIWRAGGFQAAEHLAFPLLPPASIVIDTAVPGWTTHRVAIYPKALSGQELIDAMTAGDTPTVHHLGDSFAEWAQVDVSMKLAAKAAAESAPIIISTDSAGGKAFFEGDGTGHAERWAQTPEHWGKLLILNDGALEPRGQPLIQGSIADIIRRLKLVNGEQRFIYLQANLMGAIGTTSRNDLDEREQWVKDTVRRRFILTMEAMFCAYSDADDIADVATGIWPRSLSSDGVHYLEPGRAIFASAAWGALREFGWIGGPAITAPGVPTSVAATGSTITWEPPVSDGGRPVIGYSVQRWSGSAWVNQAVQGSPTGYTRQYIREWVAPSAGTYRVAAINQTLPRSTGSVFVGVRTGDYVEVTVA